MQFLLNPIFYSVMPYLAFLLDQFDSVTTKPSIVILLHSVSFPSRYNWSLFSYLSHDPVIAWENSIGLRLKYRYSCFSSHFSFFVIFILLILLLSVLFLVVVISLSLLSFWFSCFFFIVVFLILLLLAAVISFFCYFSLLVKSLDCYIHAILNVGEACLSFFSCLFYLSGVKFIHVINYLVR